MSQFRCFNCGKIKPMDEVQKLQQLRRHAVQKLRTQLENRCPKCDADVY